MAIYHSSPLGEIHGKMNGVVAAKWKRTLIVRKFAAPTDRGSLLKYQQYKDGVPGVIFSFPQFNLRRCVILPLLKCARDHLPDWIYPIWKEAAHARGLQMNGTNLLLKDNVTKLYASMDKTIEYDPITNAPDLTKLTMTTGNLESAKITSCTYDTATGIMSFQWDTGIYNNGQNTDKAYGIVLAEPLLDSIGRSGNWEPILTMYGPTQFTDQPTRGGVGTGTGHMTINSGLTASDLTAFLFFSQVTKAGTIASITQSLIVAAP